MKILIVFGTRPEAIKMAPVINALKLRGQEIKLDVCVTGQHRHMLDQVLNFFSITPDYDLDIMRPGQDLTDITTEILKKIKIILKNNEYNFVLVHGDTTTAMAAALAAFYEKISVIHIEAGLRTGNIYAPWPEELNRNIISKIAHFNFAPTNKARHNLLKEGVPSENIAVTGNTVIDALKHVIDVLSKNKKLKDDIREKFKNIDFSKNIILVTGHRRENFGIGFERICHAIKILSQRSDIEIIYPVHLNPAVQEPVHRILGDCANVHLVEPLDYIPFVYLMDRSKIILTDSGGIQEEAPSIGKPVLVMRETTERPEAVEAGTVRLVGNDINKIVQSVEELLDDQHAYQSMISSVNPYGDGMAATKIANFFLKETSMNIKI